MQCPGAVHCTLQIRSQVRSANGLRAGNTGSDSHTQLNPPASAVWEPLCSGFTQWVEWNVAELRVRGCSQRPQRDEWLFYVLCDIMREPWPHLSSQSQQYGRYLFKRHFNSYHRHPLQPLKLGDLFFLTCFISLIQVLLQRMMKIGTDLFVHLSKSSRFIEFVYIDFFLKSYYISESEYLLLLQVLGQVACYGFTPSF
jgi:hypothetical protein